MNYIERYSLKHPFAKTSLIGWVLLLFVVIMGNYFPQNAPTGYTSFIVAFEFAKTIQDLNLLLSGLSIIEIKNIDIGNYIDFGFMLAYSIFLVIMLVKFSRIFESHWMLSIIPLCISVLLFDIIENLFLLRITSIYPTNLNEMVLVSLMQKLNIITWIKWGFLAITFSLISVKLLRINFFTGIIGMLCLLPLILAIIATKQKPFWINLFTLSVFAAFFGLFVFAIAYKHKNK